MVPQTFDCDLGCGRHHRPDDQRLPSAEALVLSDIIRILIIWAGYELAEQETVEILLEVAEDCGQPIFGENIPAPESKRIPQQEKYAWFFFNNFSSLTDSTTPII